MAKDPRPWRGLYKTAAWLRLAKAQKEREPLCATCLMLGRANDGSLTGAGTPQEDRRRRYVVADHKIPHRGDKALFFDPDNLQTLCPDHHDRDKQIEERKGYSERRGPDGWPIDPRHPANQ